MNIGDVVHIIKMKRDGVLVEILPKNKIKVSLGSFVLTLDNEEVQVLKEQPKKKPSQDKITIKPASSLGKEPEEIDLHGFTVAEALDALEQKLNRSIMSNVKRIKVIHGFGSGKVMIAVHTYLKESRLVSNFRVDDLNPGQTWVWL